MRIHRVTALAAITMSAALLLAGCGSSDTAGKRAPKVDTSRLDGPDGAATTTTRRPSDGTTSTSTPTDGGKPVASTPADAKVCGALTMIVLQPPELDPPSEGDISDEEYREAFQTVAEAAPAAERDDWASYLDILDRYFDDPTTVQEDDPAAEKLADDLLESAARWGRDRCPDVGPSWDCPVRTTFKPVGKSIDADGNSPPEDAGASPDDVLATQDDPEQAQEIDRSDDAVLYAWLDGDGVLIRTLRVDRVPGGWGNGGSTECDTGGGTFEPVGEPIEGD
jgi:hypothetical protein